MTLGTASTNINGTFAGTTALTFTVPESAVPGAYPVQAQWSDVVGATAIFTVN